MSTKNYISLSNLTGFLNNLKSLFATKTELNTKSDKTHTHAISDVSNLQSTLNGKANSSHGTHVTYSSTSPLIDGTASVGSASTVARSDHRHPTDTSRAAQTDLDALENVVSGKANSSHTHTIANITNLQTTLDAKASSSHTHNYAGSSSDGGAATSANKLNTDAGSATQPVYFSNGIPVKTTYTLGKSVPSDAKFTDTNTHYTSKNVVGATNATTNTATALTNGNVYLNSVENGAVTSSHKISGSGATTVTTDANGNIVISSTDNNTTYSAAGSSLGLVKSGGDVTISSGVITVNDDSHNHTIANIDNLQSSLDAKQATVTGAATTITGSNLTANRALISNGSGKVAVSEVTSTELGYLDGVTSNVQAQLDGKAASSHNHIKLSGWSDTRSVATTPNDYNGSLIVSGLKANSTIGSPDDSTYSGVIGFRSWSDNSGGNAHEFAFTGNGNLCRRSGATTSWGSWKTLLDSGNYKTYCTPANIGASASGHTHNYAGSSSAGGSANSAVKLQTARTIALGTGATGTATNFDGTGNITIPVTDIKESYLSWGGRSLAGSVSPIDAACSNIHSANRFAFAKAAGITIEYSTNGSTYSAYSTTDSAKINLVSGIGSTYYIGARSASTTANDKLRITLNATSMGVYTLLRKLLINISTGYSSGSNVIIEKAMKGSETTFTTVGTYNISGWSGWNSIPMGFAFGGGSTQTSNVAVLRLTFGITGVNSSQTANALTILDIVGIGDTYWSHPSTMAKTGHVYTYDSSQNTTFPASVNAPTFSGSGVATVSEVKTYLGI